MKILGKILLSLAIASSLVAVSTTASAEGDKGRITYKPAEAIDLVVSHIVKALNAIESGASSEEVNTHTKAALDSSIEINANDKVDFARSRANAHLKKARAELKSGNNQTAEEHLKAAKKAFEDLKKLI